MHGRRLVTRLFRWGLLAAVIAAAREVAFRRNDAKYGRRGGDTTRRSHT